MKEEGSVNKDYARKQLFSLLVKVNNDFMV
jgi:hypothetical protein